MWLKVDDSFVSHPKVLRAAEMLGPFGFGRTLGGWLVGQSYTGKHQTDGALPSRIVNRIDDPEPQAVVDALVSVNLWERTETGYQIHDYHDYNPKAEKVRAARKANLQRQQAYLARRLEKKAAAEIDAANAVLASISNGVNNGVNNASPIPIPIPVPIPIPHVPDAAGAWEDWRIAWEGAGLRTLSAAPPQKDIPQFTELARRFPDGEWRRLLLDGFFHTNNEDITDKPASIGWFLYWADWIDKKYRASGRKPKSEAA